MPNLVTRLVSLLVDRYNRRQFSQAGRSAKRYVGRHAVLPPQHDCEVDWRDLVLRKKGWTNCEPVTTSDDPLDFTSRDDPRGVLAPVASKILMNIWALFVRWDLLKVVAKLATMVTKWTTECDAALIGYIGDSPSALSLQLYADADFAGDWPSFKFTSGTRLCVRGPNTYLPLAGRANKSCASHSTHEAEAIPLDSGMRALVLPAVDVWEELLGRAIKVFVFPKEHRSKLSRAARTGARDRAACTK